MNDKETGDSNRFLKSLGFPNLKVHHAFNHFDFTKANRRILVIGPMGSGKTEFSAKMWRDARVAQKKTGKVSLACSGNSTIHDDPFFQGCESTPNKVSADRRNIFFVRFSLDRERFPDYPDDALAFRGGYERCGDRIAQANDSFALEKLINDNPDIGTWVIDEAAFYDERVAYLTRNEAERNGKVFVFPSLILNFRKEIFNPTARLLVEHATDVFALTAYCEHDECILDSFYTYRYYLVDGAECPALYFDPLIIIGGDREKTDPLEPNYCTRCDEHHYLPGKEYTFFFLKPKGEAASRGNEDELFEELKLLHTNPNTSTLGKFLHSQNNCSNDAKEVMLNSLKVPCLAEKALVYLYAEQNLLSSAQVVSFAERLALNTDYLEKRLNDMRRSVKA